MASPGPTYGYRELADRIEQVLGVRPSLSTLRAARSETRRTKASSSRPRITYGMPLPRQTGGPTSPAAFSVREVEAWLKRHPRSQWANTYDRLVAVAGKPSARVDASVARARRAGLSWRQIAQALTDGSGVRHSPAGVHKRYRDADSL